MLAKKVIALLSWILIILGIASFLYIFANRTFIFGIFEIGFAYGFLYMVMGIYAIISTKKGTDSAKKLVKIYGMTFGVLGLIGLLLPETLPYEYIIGSNISTNIFHLIVGGIFFLIGKTKIR